MTIPSAHMQVLATEADLWAVGRGDFLTMLLRRKHGELPFERPKNAPTYSFKESELLEMERYAWYLPMKDVPKLESDRIKLGNMTVSNWVTVTLNDWIGKPAGIGEQEIVRRLLLKGIQKLIPDAKAPAEPYWGLFEVDRFGETSGNIWVMEPGEVALFEDKKIAQRVATLIKPPSESTSWAARGVTKEYLRLLKTTPQTKLFLGELKEPDQLACRPLT